MTKIAIIGAGLSGLSIAHLLKDYAQISLFEKSRGVSGRMSTRRAQPYFFDHGAPYFTVRTKSFQQFIQPLLHQGVIKKWDARYLQFKHNQIIDSGRCHNEEPKYVGVPNMNQIAKFLAKDLNIHINTRITSINHQEKWQLVDDKKQQYSDFDWIICTVPPPQSAALMPNFFKYHNDISTTKMQACFALMLGFKQNILLPFEVAHLTDSDLSWIIVNSHKPERSGDFSLMVYSSNEYAETHIDDNSEDVMQHLIRETSRIINHDAGIAEYKTIHKWRYANNIHTKQISNALLDKEHHLAVCGDWCFGGQVEDAFTSAYTLALAMKENAL